MPTEKPLPSAKVRPLIRDLIADFNEFKGDDDRLSEDEFFEIWRKCVQNKVAEVTEEDLNIMRAACSRCFKSMDVSNDGHVTMDEFVSFMMGTSENRGPMRAMSNQMREALKVDPTKLQRMVDMFRVWDKNGDGFITQDELSQHLEELQVTAPMPDVGFVETLRMKAQIFDQVDVDQDGQIDMWEFMAHFLGRRKTPVEVLLYHVGGFVSTTLAPLMVGKGVQAIHSGVLVYNKEYWYGGQVVRSAPPCRQAFGEPLAAPFGEQLPMSERFSDLPVLKIGYTLVEHREFLDWLKTKVAPRYEGFESYDLLLHSCNHFTNEVVTFLTGRPLPEKVFQMQKMLLTPTVQKIAPYINRVLGGFAAAHKGVKEDRFCTDYMPEETEEDADEIAHGVLGKGEIVKVDVGGETGEVLATLLSEEGDRLKVRFFCPATGQTVVRSDVPSTARR